METSICHDLGTRNITIHSPLLETVAWRESNGIDTGSVDVETYHIFKALQEPIQRGTRVVPGGFFSDMVGGGAPLVEKINHKNALGALPILMNDVLTYIQVN